MAVQIIKFYCFDYSVMYTGNLNAKSETAKVSVQIKLRN